MSVSLSCGGIPKCEVFRSIFGAGNVCDFVRLLKVSHSVLFELLAS